VADRREIFGWLMYDWANSAFYTTVVTVLLGPYLTALAQSEVGENGTVLSLGPLGAVTAKSLFPYAISLSVAGQVVLLPVLGALADHTRFKKQMMAVCCYIGAAATCLLFFITGGLYLVGALLLIIANVSYGAAIVFYNSYLNDISTEDQRDRLSSRGYAIGYLGGGLLLGANLVLITGADALGISKGMAVRLSLLSAGLWWGGFALITFRRLKTRAPVKEPAPGQSYLTIGIRELTGTFAELKRLPRTLRYLVAYMGLTTGYRRSFPCRRSSLRRSCSCRKGCRPTTRFSFR
jgi:UMF1 family MFS transporter